MSAVDDAALGRFLVGLAEGMNASADSVDHIRDTMTEVSTAYGRDDISFVVLPTVILVETGGAGGRVTIRSATNASFRFDQIAALYALVAEAKRTEVEPAEGIRRLNSIGVMRARFGGFVRTLGHAVLTAGLALLLAPTWQGVIIAFLLGALVGALKVIRSPTLQLIMPVAAAFLCATAVFLLAQIIEIGDPIRLLIAPLVTFLPGGVLTTATTELAAGQMQAGSARLISGFVQLGLLAFGIVAAGTVVGVGSDSYQALSQNISAPWWVPFLGLVIFALGNYLHFSAPTATFGWVLLALLVAYLGQLIGIALAGAAISGFIGAVAMTPVVLWVATLRHGAPSQLTFLPAFWLLVPGAAGLVGLTEAVATEGGLLHFVEALASVLSIALGVLIGTALYRVVRHGAEEVAHFTVASSAHAATPIRPPRWAWLRELFLRRSSRERSERAE